MNIQTNRSSEAARTGDFSTNVFRLARQIAELEPGPAASLRRGPLSGVGSAAFWQLMAKNEIYGGDERLDRWATVVQGMAILTPKGRDSRKRSAHDARTSMGAVLHRAGFSDLRLARLLGAKGSMGRELIIRACRRLAAADADPFDLRTLAALVLFDDDRARHHIARNYYRAAAAANSPEGES